MTDLFIFNANDLNYNIKKIFYSILDKKSIKDFFQSYKKKSTTFESKSTYTVYRRKKSEKKSILTK